MSRNRLSDNVLLGSSFHATPLSGGSILSRWLNMGDSDSALFQFKCVDPVSAPLLTVTVNAAEDDLGTNDETIKTQAGISVNSEDEITVDVHSEDLPEGKPFVQVVLAETVGGAASVIVEAAHLLDNLRKKYGNRPGAAVRIATWE